MVCKPVPWGKKFEDRGIRAESLFDLTGGYLTTESTMDYIRYHKLSSGELAHFHIYLNDYSELCSVMKKLQNQAFEVNTLM